MQADEPEILAEAADECVAGPDRPVRVALVGAGPGDPELLTVKAVRAIGAADVILHDRLIGPDVLKLARADATVIDVGKRSGNHAATQAEINRMLIEHARTGARVIRLKGGDPFIFGRGGEELAALAEAGIFVEVIPGITAAAGAAARLALPLTQRGIGQSLHIASGHGAGAVERDDDWTVLAKPGATLVLYMGGRTLGAITVRMMDDGVPPGLPAVAIENATLPNERARAGTVADIAEAVAGFDGPMLVIFGAVAARARLPNASPLTGRNGTG